jgi:hypothetical protein
MSAWEATVEVFIFDQERPSMTEDSEGDEQVCWSGETNLPVIGGSLPFLVATLTNKPPVKNETDTPPLALTRLPNYKHFTG